MFDHRHYVPVLKGKRAEFPALQTVQSHDSITPLFEAVPTGPADFVPKKMSAFWDNDRPYFIDMLFFDDETMEESESHPISDCFAEVAAKGQIAIPVTGTGRSPSYQAAVAAINGSQGAARPSGFLRTTLRTNTSYTTRSPHSSITSKYPAMRSTSSWMRIRFTGSARLWFAKTIGPACRFCPPLMNGGR